MDQIDPLPRPSDGVVRLFQDKPPADRGSDAPWLEIEGALVDDGSLAVPAFPLDTIPAPWRDWIVDTARSVNVPADYVAQAVMAGVAGVCGAGVWLRISPVWLEPMWLWLTVVGAPSSGKSPALVSMHRLLRMLETEPPFPKAVEQYEPMSLKRRPPKIFGHGDQESLVALAQDNQRGVILWRDEPAGCFAPLVDGGAVQALDRFPVTILGSLEPDRLAATVQRGEESLAARFLYAWPAPPPFCPLAERRPAQNDVALARLRAIRAKAGTLADPLGLWLDPEGLAALDGFLAGLHAELRLVEGLEAAWLGKGRGVVPRLAGVLHMLDWSAAQAADPSVPVGDIGRTTVDRAIALWSDYYRPHAKAFFDRTAPSTLDSRARRVVRWLKAAGLDVISREDVRRTALGQTVNATEADRVLARLIQAGILRPVTPEAGPKGGRPALRWEVNPALRAS